IPPRRVGGRLSMVSGSVSGDLEFFRASEQNQIAAYETPTPGYDMLNLTVSFAPFGEERGTFFMRGSNLLDEEVRSHASFMARVVPMPGRNLSAGFRHSF